MMYHAGIPKQYVALRVYWCLVELSYCCKSVFCPNFLYNLTDASSTKLSFACKVGTLFAHKLVNYRCGSRGGPGGPGPPLDPRFWGPKIEHFWALFNFSIIFFASLCSSYYFFNMLLFHSSNWKIFQPRFARHVISHLQVFVSHILDYYVYT